MGFYSGPDTNLTLDTIDASTQIKIGNTVATSGKLTTVDIQGVTQELSQSIDVDHTARVASVFIGDSPSSSSSSGVADQIRKGVRSVYGVTVYDNTPAGIAAVTKSEKSFDPSLPTNHEGEPVAGEKSPGVPVVGVVCPSGAYSDEDLASQVSKYFKLSDCKMVPVDVPDVPSQTATVLSKCQVAQNWANLCTKILDPVYEKYKFKINSGFRTVKYNQSIGSKDTSDHCTGCAADISIGRGEDNIPLFQFILKSGLPFSQLIYEGNWVHVSFNGKGPKGAAKIMYTFDGKNPQIAGQNGENLPPQLKA
jgi:hypothetical protein